MKTLEVMWQGSQSDILDIQHLLYAFDVQIAQHDIFLALMFPGEKVPMILGLGDTVILNDMDQLQIRRREHDA